MNIHDIELPAEFRSGNSIPVERATITRERMTEILQDAIEADRQRIAELESQLEAIGAGGVSGQPITSQRRGEPVAFAKDGNLFWRGDPVAWREFSGELYLAPQPVDPVELDRYDAGLLGGQDGMPAYVWHDIIRAELDRAYDFYMDQLDRATPQPAEPVKAPSEDERAAQGLPPYSPRHLTEEEWNRLAENGRRAWGNHPDGPAEVPSVPPTKRSFTVEPHGNGYAIYQGRDNFHHGLNLASLTECTPEFAKRIESALNESAEQTDKECLSVADPEKEPPCET